MNTIIYLLANTDYDVQQVIGDKVKEIRDKKAHEKKWCKVVEDIDIATEWCDEEEHTCFGGWYNHIGKKIKPNILPMSPFYHTYWTITNEPGFDCYILYGEDAHEYDERFDEVPYDSGGTWFSHGSLVSFQTASRLLPTPQQARDLYHYL